MILFVYMHTVTLLSVTCSCFYCLLVPFVDHLAVNYHYSGIPISRTSRGNANIGSRNRRVQEIVGKITVFD